MDEAGDRPIADYAIVEPIIVGEEMLPELGVSAPSGACAGSAFLSGWFVGESDVGMLWVSGRGTPVQSSAPGAKTEPDTCYVAQRTNE